MVNWYKSLLVSLVILLFAVPTFAAEFLINSYQYEAVGGGTQKWVGFPNTDGTPASPGGSWADYGTDADRTYCRLWTAVEDGTVQAVSIRHSNTNAWQDAWLVVYNGTTVIGTYNISGDPDDDTWGPYRTITVSGAESLDFSTSDDIYFGISWDCDSGSADFTRDTSPSGGEDASNFHSEGVEGTPSGTMSGSWTTSTSEGYGIIMRYITR